MTIEDRVRSGLHEAARAADIRFDADDVRRSARDGVNDRDTITTRSSSLIRRGPGLFAAAALVLVIGCVGYLTTRSSSSVQVDTATDPTSTAPPTDQSADNPEAEADTNPGPEPFVELELVEIDEAPIWLDERATIIGGERSGRVEVGPPTAALIAEQPEFEEGRCVATSRSVACTSGPSADDDGAGTLSRVESKDDRRNGVIGGRDGIFVLYEEQGSVIVAGLPETTATVTFETDVAIDDGRYRRTPIAGAAPFPLIEEATWFRLIAIDDDGSIIYDTLRFDLPASSDTACGPTLPVTFEVLDRTEPGVDRFTTSDGVLVEQHSSAESETVEVRWPGTPPALYGFDAEPSILLYPRLRGALPAPGTPITFDLFELYEGPTGISMSVTPLPSVTIPAGCDLLEIVTRDGTDELHRFAVDLNAVEGEIPFVDLVPRITSTENVDVLPTPTIAQCEGGPLPNIADEVTASPTFATAAEAFDAFMSTEPATTFLQRGWHEMVSDGAVAYGIPFDDVVGGPTSATKMITVVTVTEAADGWRVTHWTASGC